MKKLLITDFLHNKKVNNYSEVYLELPNFDNQHNIIRDKIRFKKWNNYKIKLNDIKKNFELYEYFLSEITYLLNNYHNKNFSKKYWSIVLGPWLFRFISSISFRWNLLNSLKKENFFYLKKKISLEEIIPLGIEDYTKISNSHYWNHYIYTKIIEYSFKKKIKIIQGQKLIKNYEREVIYEKLKNKNIKDFISFNVQKILNFFFPNKNTLIFSTYMSNLQEIKLNFLLNKSLLYYKILRPYHLYKNDNLFKFKRKNSLKFKSSRSDLKDFLGKEILSCLPSAYLENFENIGNIVKQIPFPKFPEKIFTTLGISRSTLLDRYIAESIARGSLLILSQHGGVYFQYKNHFYSTHELKIADKYLSWGNIRDKKISPIGIIKNIKNLPKIK